MELIRLITRNVISIFAGLFLVFLGLRIAFRVLGLSATNSLVDTVYNVSGRLVAPIEGIISLPVITLSPSHVIDLNAIIALLVYALAASVLLNVFARLWRQPTKR